MTETGEIVTRIMDRATTATPNALFGALQAALGVLSDLEHRHGTPGEGMRRIERALEVGGPVGSPQWIAHHSTLPPVAREEAAPTPEG